MYVSTTPVSPASFAERRPERARQRVAADPEAQRIGVGQAGATLSALGAAAAVEVEPRPCLSSGAARPTPAGASVGAARVRVRERGHGRPPQPTITATTRTPAQRIPASRGRRGAARRSAGVRSSIASDRFGTAAVMRRVIAGSGQVDRSSVRTSHRHADRSGAYPSGIPIAWSGRRRRQAVSAWGRSWVRYRSA